MDSLDILLAAGLVVFCLMIVVMIQASKSYEEKKRQIWHEIEELSKGNYYHNDMTP